jgi:hypothetical protein
MAAFSPRIEKLVGVGGGAQFSRHVLTVAGEKYPPFESGAG